MKVVIKFGGTSIATVKDIKNVVRIVSALSNKNKLVVVCSAGNQIKLWISKPKSIGILNKLTGTTMIIVGALLVVS